MKKFSLSLLGLGMSVFVCQAQISVWKMNLKDTTTGNGQTIKASSTGFFIVDFSASQAAFIQVFPDNHFNLFEPADADFDYGNAIGAKNAATWVFTLNKSFGALTASGKAASLNLGVVGIDVTLPKTMAVNGSILTSTGSVRTLDKFSGAFVFDLPDTKTANVLGDALADTENRLITALQNQGLIYDGPQPSGLLKRP